MPSGEAPILIAYDGSDNAKHAIAVAGEALAARPALVVTVWESVLGLAYRHPMPGDLGVTQDVVEEMDRGARKAATEAAEEGVELARSAGLDRSRSCTAATGARTRRSSSSRTSAWRTPWWQEPAGAPASSRCS